MASLLHLPDELKSMIVDHMAPTDLRQARLACRKLQQITFDRFVKMHFLTICILPTKKALDRVKEIYSNVKFANLNLVVDVEICSSIYRFSHYEPSQELDDEEEEEEEEACSVWDPPDICSDDCGPFEHVSHEWHAATNTAVQYLTDVESFVDDCAEMMSHLTVNNLTVQNSYPKVAEDGLFTNSNALIIGRRRLVQATSKDPLQKTQKSPTWDVLEPDIHTLMCDAVMLAATLTHQDMDMVKIGGVQPQFMDIMTHDKLLRESPTWGTLRMLSLEINMRGFDAGAFDYDAMDLLRFLRMLPALSYLDLECSYGEGVIFKDLFLPCLDHLSVGLCSDGLNIAYFSSFLARHKLTLLDFHAEVAIWEDDRREPWQKLFKQLAIEIKLREFSITLNQEQFEGETAGDIAGALTALIEAVMRCPLMGDLLSDYEISDDENSDDDISGDEDSEEESSDEGSSEEENSDDESSDD